MGRATNHPVEYATLFRPTALWKKMKYEWLPFKSFTPEELEQAIDQIGAGFGSEYQLTFC